MSSIHEPEVVESQVPVVTGLEAQTRGEIDIQIATAKRFPRSVSLAIKEATSLATLNEDVAESCFYALPRDGKTVEGPSARLAEIVASCWGHMRIEARVVDEDEKFVTSRGTAWDLQRNVAIAYEVRRRITGKKGKFNDDMIGVASNAANSIALRNAILKVVPKAFWQTVYEQARKTAVGDAETLVNKRAKMMGYFGKLGVNDVRVFSVLGVRGLDDITLDHLATLKGLATAIKEGDTTIENAFPIEIKEPQRVSPAATDTAAAPQSSPAPTTAPQATDAAPVPTPLPDARSAPAAASVAPADEIERGLKIVNTAMVVGKDKVNYYELTTSRGVFYTREERLFKSAESCEGADDLFTITWRWGKKDSARVKVALILGLDEGGQAPAEGQAQS
jgi:hypothetical protein